MSTAERIIAVLAEAVPQSAAYERALRLDEARAIRKLLVVANSYREALELLDKHINAMCAL